MPYAASLLLDTLRRTPAGVDARIDPLDGTLVFADISGFTALSERLAELGKEGAERLTDIINANFERMLDITRDHGGSNLKFGGDAMLLAFTGEEHAFHAVAASLAMQRAIASFGLIRVGGDRVRLSMSVGVHTGRFWAAIAGDPARRMQHFVLGSEAGVLADTEGTASPGKVLITEATRALVTDSVAVVPHAGLHRAERLTRRRPRVAPPGGRARRALRRPSDALPAPARRPHARERRRAGGGGGRAPEGRDRLHQSPRRLRTAGRTQPGGAAGGATTLRRHRW